MVSIISDDNFFSDEILNDLRHLLDWESEDEDDLETGDLTEWIQNTDVQSQDSFTPDDACTSSSSVEHEIPSNNYLNEPAVPMNLGMSAAIINSNANSYSGIQMQQQQYKEALTKLELSMRRTEQTRSEVMSLRHSFTVARPPSQLLPFERVDNLVSGKRRSLTLELEDSRKRLKEFMSQTHVTNYNAPIA